MIEFNISFKRWYVQLYLTCLLLFCMSALTAENDPDKKENQTYQSGESLKYSLKYGFIKGGHISFSVKDTVWKGVETLELKLLANTSGMVDAIFKVRDTYISYVDPVTDLPLKSVRDIREGRYKYYNEVRYDHTKVLDDSITIHSMKSGEVNVPSLIHDIVSAFYYARRYKFNEEMKVGDILEFTTYFSDEIFPLKIKYMGVETIGTAFGDKECYLFYPVTEVGRVFETEEDMKVWITRDKNRIPIKAKVNLKVGSFSCDLIEYKGLKNKLGTL